MKYVPKVVPDNLTPFADIVKLRSGNENQLDHYSSNYAMEYFQATDWVQLRTILNKIDELKLNGNKTYTPDTRTKVLTALKLPFDEKRAQYFDEMIELCAKLSNDTPIIEKGLSGFIAFAARKGTDGTAGKNFLAANQITATYGTPEFKTEFQNFANRFIASQTSKS
jgi:hypothetical protein